MEHRIKVTTFKQSGKYYDEFDIIVEAEPTWWDVSQAVRRYKQTSTVQTSMDWLIGMSEDGLHPDVANGVYPMIIKD